MEGGLTRKQSQAVEEAGSALLMAYRSGVRGKELAARFLDKLGENCIKTTDSKATVKVSNMRPDGTFRVQVVGTELGDSPEFDIGPMSG